jgi:hypothetical protein
MLGVLLRQHLLSVLHQIEIDPLVCINVPFWDEIVRDPCHVCEHTAIRNCGGIMESEGCLVHSMDVVTAPSPTNCTSMTTLK